MDINTINKLVMKSWQRHEKYTDRLQSIIDQQSSFHSFDDVEEHHFDADDLLCELLTELGYGDVVEVYNKIEKWYG